jgi:hypothetical protein
VPVPVNEEKSIRKKLSPEAKSAATWSREVPSATVFPAASSRDQARAPPSADRKTAILGPCWK